MYSFRTARDQVNDLASFIRDSQNPSDDEVLRAAAKGVWVVGMTLIQIAQELNEIKLAMR